MMHRALTLRTSTIKLAMKSKIDLKNARRDEESRAERLKSLYLNKELEKTNRQKILDFLKLDSQNWYDVKNIDNRLLTETLIPDVTVSHTDYYRNLQDVLPGITLDGSSQRDRRLRRP